MTAREWDQYRLFQRLVINAAEATPPQRGTFAQQIRTEPADTGRS